MNNDPASLRGRGAADNPPNRFERLHYAADPDADHDDDPAPTTHFLKDTARTIIVRNDSPDVGFAASINPYRGCEHGCAYCLEPNTPVLYADVTWRPIGGVQPGDVLLGFDESPLPNRVRKLQTTIVEAVWWSRRPTLRVITDPTEVMTTAEHLWLEARNGRWTPTRRLRPGHRLKYMPTAEQEVCDEDYRAGYVAGLSLGDGTFRYEPGWRSDRLGFPAAYWRIALVDPEPLERTIEYLQYFGVEAYLRPFADGANNPRHRPLQKVEIRSLGKLAVIHGLLQNERPTRSYRRGFVAGFFDAEGCCSYSLRFSQVDRAVLERVRRYTESLGFSFYLEPRRARASTLRLSGYLSEQIRFFSVCRPAIRRKWESLFGWHLKMAAEPILAIEPGPAMDVVDIQTTTRTFYAAGIATHNCYARPTHEYLGFSAGLDFETKILVKEDAPELLRHELAKPSWQPEVLSLSGVTDPYQPVERRLRLTRRCLEVLAEFRNPVAIVTKSQLVTRDIDLLVEMARDEAAAVFVSVTSLDGDLARLLEPRATQPAGRIAAIAALAAAGVPTGVMVAPVIPGLTDHEMPAILAAAAQAGARCAGFIPLRLPLGVAPLFTQWLERHFPDRKEKVLGRIRALRGGKLNDARFGSRMRGEGILADTLTDLFQMGCRRAGITGHMPSLSTAAFRRPGGTQRMLFD